MACVVAQAGCSLFYLQATLAQEQDRVTIDAHRCLELESPDERLACFEKQVDDASSPGSTAPATAGAPAPSTQQSTPTVDIADLPAASASADPRSYPERVGTITSLKERAPNQYLITLDNGQVWRQRFSERYLLRVGQRVRVYYSSIGGGLRLQADGVNGFIQVDRVK